MKIIFFLTQSLFTEYLILFFKIFCKISKKNKKLTEVQESLQQALIVGVKQQQTSQKLYKWPQTDLFVFKQIISNHESKNSKKQRLL